MANIKIEIPITMLDEKTAIQMKNSFNNISIPWTFCQKEAIFSSNVIIKKVQNNLYMYELAGIKKLIKMFPDINVNIRMSKNCG